MNRLTLIPMLAAGVAFSMPVIQAQAIDAPHHARKAGKVRRAPAPATAPRSGGINTPSTDFSKIERADGDAGGPNGPTFHPTMGAGGMGLGGAF